MSQDYDKRPEPGGDTENFTTQLAVAESVAKSKEGQLTGAKTKVEDAEEMLGVIERQVKLMQGIYERSPVKANADKLAQAQIKYRVQQGLYKNAVGAYKQRETEYEYAYTQYSDALKAYNDYVGVDENYINSFFKEVHQFFKETETDSKSLGYGNATQMYDTKKTSVADFQKRAQVISDFIEKNKGNLKQEDYDSLVASMKAIEEGLSQVSQGYLDAKEYYGQWATEEDNNAAVKEYEREQGYLNYDTSAGEAKLAELENRITVEIPKQREELATKIRSTKDKALQQQYHEEVLRLEELEYQLQDEYNDLESYINTAKDKQIYQADMKEIEAMPEAVRMLLKEYATAHDLAPTNMHHAIKADECMAQLQSLGYSREKIDELAETYTRALNAEQMGGVYTAADNATSSTLGTIFSNIGAYGAKFVGALIGTYGALKGATRSLFNDRYSSLDPNLPEYALSNWADGVRQNTAEQIESGIGGTGGMVAAGVYSAVNSAADNLLRIYATGGTGALTLNAMDTFQQTAQSVSKRGGTVKQALSMGVVAAGIEALTEKYSIENLLNIKNAKGFMNRLKTVAVQAGVEISEEELSLIGNTLADAVIMGDKSEFNLNVRNYMDRGMTSEEAQKRAMLDLAEQALDTAFESGLSGGIMAGTQIGIQSAADKATVRKANITIGQAAKSQENFKVELEGVIQEAMKLPETAEAHHLAVAAQKKISAGKELSDAEVGALYRKTAMEVSGENKNTAPEEGTVKPMLRMEDFINPNSDVFRNVEYDDKATQNNIMRSTHAQMVADGNVAVIGSDALGTVEQAYPDLRSMKKEERTKILREKVKGLKQSLRSFLSGLKGNYKFEVNGNILEAKLYDTGINEVLDRVTKDKASMLYGSKDIFEKAQYLYSTPDYEGNPNIYRWNYFYTPVQIGDTVTGVRIAVRDMAKTAESQIYHWGIKNEATLGGGGDGNTVSHTDASSAASNNNIAQPVKTVNNEGGNQNGQATGNQPVGAADLSAGQGNIGRAAVSDGERGGTIGAGAYEQAAPVARGARESRGADGRRAAFERQARNEALRNAVRDVLPRSPAKLGIPGGEQDATLKIVPVAYQTEEMKQVEAWFAEHGISAYFFVGSLSIQQNGKQFTANGMLHGDRVFIRADSPFFDLEQIAEHEKFHLLKRENPGMVEQLMYELQNEYSPEAFKQIVDKYVKAYGKVIDMSKEDAELRIWNEILADAYAGMNARAVDVAAYQDDVTQRVQKYTGEGRQAQSNGVRQTNGPNSQAIGNVAEFAIEYDVRNKPFVIVEDDILAGVPKKDWVRTVKNNLRNNFPNGIAIGNNTIQINAKSRREMTYSNYMQSLLRENPEIYGDKLRATNNADEILYATQNWVNEALLHPRNDAIIDFARGTVQIRVGENDYTAEVIVGNRGEGNLLLYDIINLTPTTIYEKKTGSDYTTKPQNEPGSRQSKPVSINSISNSSENVNTEKWVPYYELSIQEVMQAQIEGRYDENTKMVLVETADSQAIENADPEFALGSEPVDTDMDIEERMRHYANVPEYQPGMESSGVEAEDVDVDDLLRWDEPVNGRRQNTGYVNVPKSEFEGTPHLRELGVQIENSVGDYWGTAAAVAHDKAAKQMKRQIKRAEIQLNATEAEKDFAAGIAAGRYYAEDIPGRLDYDVVMELADYYAAEAALDTDMLREKKARISSGLFETMKELFKDSDAYTPSRALVMNYRTPERNMLKIFGEKQGKEIIDAIFAPVAVNEAERYRFMNRMFDEVRTFEDSNGKRRELTKEERAMVMMHIEGKAASEIAAGMEMSKSIQSAAANIAKGDDSGDAAREWGLGREERRLAEQVAVWIQVKEAMDSGKIDAKLVDEAAEKYREMFDKFYDAINDFLVAHGYETIGFVRGYAPHIQPEQVRTTMNKAFHKMGIDADVGNLPASIAGMTADFKPNKRWNPHMQHRRTIKTQYDIAKAYESYVEYMSDILYHTDDIMRVRQAANYFRRTYAPEEIKNMLEWAEELRKEKRPEQKAAFLRANGKLGDTSFMTAKDIDEQFNEFVDTQYQQIENAGKYSELVKYLENYANILAGKQSYRDRGAEANGREIMAAGNKLVRTFARSQVAGSISSALNQTAQLPQIIAEVGDVNVGQALWDIVSGKLKKAAWAQESDFLVGKEGIDFLVTEGGEKMVSNLFKPATFVDGLISTLAVRGEYLKQVKAGKSHQEAMKLADKKGTAIMGSRMKGSKPVAFHAKNFWDSIINVFQIEALNSWEHLSQDLPRDFHEIAAEKGKRAAAGALAGVLVKMILAAFVINRLDDELYGGTPAPFDVLGLTANFIASGEGLTTNQYLCTVFDNAWEKMTGERVFGTDASELEGDFDWGAAVEDTAYNISNEVPFLRNVSAVLGWGDDTLPLPNIAGTLKDGYEAILEGKPEKLPEVAFGLAADVIPGGRQLEKTAQGLETYFRGGKYSGYGDSKKLQYPVEQNAVNFIKAVLFGRSGLGQSEFYADGGQSLSEKQTKAFEKLVDAGFSSEEIYDLMTGFRDLEPEEGKEDVSNLQKYMEVAGTVWSDEMKDAALETIMPESSYKKYKTALNAGITTYWYFQFLYNIKDLEGEKDSNGNTVNGSLKKKIVKEIDRMDFTKKQKDTLYLLQEYVESGLKDTPWH